MDIAVTDNLCGRTVSIQLRLSSALNLDTMVVFRSTILKLIVRELGAVALGGSTIVSDCKVLGRP